MDISEWKSEGRQVGFAHAEQVIRDRKIDVPITDEEIERWPLRICGDYAVSPSSRSQEIWGRGGSAAWYAFSSGFHDGARAVLDPSVRGDFDVDDLLRRMRLTSSRGGWMGAHSRYAQKDMLETLQSLKRKLHPSRYTGMSGKMAAIVAYIVGDVWTDPYIVGIIVTSDGGVLARQADDIGYNNWIGSEEDLTRNWLRLLEAAGLTQEEMRLADEMYAMKVPPAGEEFD
jgi:hypothetical protein